MGAQAPIGQFFCYKRGALIKKDGSEQTFNGFRAMYSNGLHYTTSAPQAESESYTTFRPSTSTRSAESYSTTGAVAASARARFIWRRGWSFRGFLAVSDCQRAEFATLEFGTEQPDGHLDRSRQVGHARGVPLRPTLLAVRVIRKDEVAGL